LQVEQRIVRVVRGADQFVELDLHRLGIPVLRVLDQEHHEKGDDGGPGIDHQLPGVAEAEDRPGEGPGQNHPDGDREAQRAGGEARSRPRQPGEHSIADQGAPPGTDGREYRKGARPAPQRSTCSAGTASPYRSCSSLPMISTSTKSPGCSPASRPFWTCTTPSISGASAMVRAMARSPSTTSTRQRCTLPTLASSFCAEISACTSMKRASRSCFTSSATGSGSAFAPAPSTGE